MNGILTVKQVAERLHVDRETVYTLLRKKQLASFRVGRLWRITEEQLQAFLNHGHGASQQSGD